VVGAYHVSSKWRADVCIPNVSVTLSGTLVDSTFRLFIAQPADVSALDSHANLELSMQRNTVVLSATSDFNTWVARKISPTHFGAFIPETILNFAPSFYRPWASNSPWNLAPVNPVLGTVGISTAGAGGTNFAQCANGDFGDQAFYAVASDPPATVHAYVNDELGPRNVIIPHFPAGAQPSTGSDHHIDIFDSPSNTWYSFWAFQPDLVNVGPLNWTAGNFSIYKGDGTGWGTPSKPQGPRASGVAAIAGMPRTWEQNLPMLNHAVPFGVDLGTVLDKPVFPATSQDVSDYTYFTGPFHYGTLFMLPSTFNVAALSTPQARAFARTLMKYGGYLVDTTSGPPGSNGGGFNFYGEIGSLWGASCNYNGTVCVDLDTMRTALRAVTSVSGWTDCNGNAATPTPWSAMNLLSMRGPWLDNITSGAVTAGVFNTVSNLYEFPDTTGIPQFGNLATYYPRDDTSLQPWNNWVNNKQFFTSPVQGQQYTLSCFGNGSTASVRLAVWHGDFSTAIMYSNMLTPGQSQTFTMPTDAVNGLLFQVLVLKDPGPAASIRLELVAS
jgi:hypothetical protein